MNTNTAKNPVSAQIPEEFAWIQELSKEQMEILKFQMNLSNEHRAQINAQKQSIKDDENRLREIAKDKKERRTHKFGLTKLIGTALLALIILFSLGGANLLTSGNRFEQNTGMSRKDFSNDVQQRYAESKAEWSNSLSNSGLSLPQN